MLEVRDITLRFGERTVLDRVNVHVDDGEVVALMGPSGSGKSTLLRVIAGLLEPDSGTVLIDGASVDAVPPHRRRVGLVFQDEQLFPHLDVAGNIGFGLRMQGWTRARTAARVAELLQLVGLAGFAERRVQHLSGGEAKRVALARALAPQPAVLLLDEPLTGLDHELHQRLVADLAAVLRTAGTTALLVTHDRAEAAALAARTVEWHAERS